MRLSSAVWAFHSRMMIALAERNWRIATEHRFWLLYFGVKIKLIVIGFNNYVMKTTTNPRCYLLNGTMNLFVTKNILLIACLHE